MNGHRTLATVRHAAARQAFKCRRSYHSYEHTTSPIYTAAEEAILKAAIAYVPEHGFTTTALNNGARDAGYLEVSTNLFPAGIFSLVKYHLVTQRLAIGKDAPRPSAEGPVNVLENVRTLTLKRLRANEPIINRWQEAIAILAIPRNIPDSLRELALLSDEIHFLAGDTSVDTSWYTKRAGLSAIYASTEMFMTQDRSVNFKDTEEFLDRRLDGAQGLRTAVRDVGQWAGLQGMGIINALRSKGIRI
ncbi:MAG: hypothetical protein Q9219_001018 [cf. Caloplaca sp. 3 TL-2023]